MICCIAASGIRRGRDAADDVRGAEQADGFFQRGLGEIDSAEDAGAGLDGHFRKFAQNFLLQFLADDA